MKRIFPLVLVIALVFSGCSIRRTDITRGDIIDAYQKAGYTVWSTEYDAPLEEGEIAYVQAIRPDGDYIYFSFFESNEQAKRCKELYYHPVAMSFFALIYGEMNWPRWEVYGSIIAEYNLFDSELLEPFSELMKSK